MNRIRNSLLITSLFAFLLLMLGCTAVNHQITKTGMFNDDLDAMMVAWGQIKRNETTLHELQELGFDLDASNVQYWGGQEAVRQILSDEAFRNPERLDAFLEMFSHYEMYDIPYIDMTSKKDRFYINKKNSERKGDEVKLSVVLKDGVVAYAGHRKVRVDEYGSDSAFAQGFLEVIGDFAGLKDLAK
jgi:hypothetical protein